MNKPLLSLCIVLYNSSFSQSKAVSSLLTLTEELENIQVCLYLNGQCISDIGFKNTNFNLIDNNGENFYLLKNYQNCIERAKKDKSEWIVFFDQDTEITQEYLVALNNLTELDNDCVASFPILKAQKKFVSPKTLFHGTLFPSKLLKPGNYNNIDFLGLNSGSVYRVSFLKTIIDIAEVFRLDFIDYVFSYSVFKSGQSFNVMDVELNHDMAVLNNKPLDESRAESILAAEYNYYSSYRSKFALYLYKLKLITKLIRSVVNKNYLYGKTILIKYLLKKD